MKRSLSVIALIVFLFTLPVAAKRAVTVEDLFATKDIGEARLSPDGRSIVFTLSITDLAKNRSFATLWLVAAAGDKPVQLTTGEFGDATPRWSPDGKWIAFMSNRDGKAAIWVMELATKQMKMLAPVERSNFFHSKAGEMMCWSPDSKQVAFVAAEIPAVAESRDPLVISRIQYKTRTSFSDNLRLHIYTVSLEDQAVKQVTRGSYDEHSIAWSPDGKEIAFLTNRQADPDANFNYDIFTIEVATGKQRRLTQTPGVEFQPVWSPDGNSLAYSATKRLVTTIDSIAEDSHIWVIKRDGTGAKEVSAALDRRAGTPQWSPDGGTIYFTAGDRGRTLVYRVSATGDGAITPIVDQNYQIGSFTIAGQTIAFTRSDELAPADLWSADLTGSQMKQLTAVNKELLEEWKLVKPAGFKFKSFDKIEVEGWLMAPLDFDPAKKHPLLLTIHGGPHGAYGYSFNLTNQLYAAKGYAVLYINPRGSSGYGQKFSDGSVGNWGGGDYQDLMRGVEVTLANYKWIDPNRLGVMGGSYGGFMTNWVITQTDRFKAAVASASLSNLISFYGTSLYQDLIHTEFNGLPWNNYDLLWKYSPIRYVRNVRTPTLFIHGEVDNDVHITQAEEMYMALKRLGVESVLVRYPREGHGLREPQHRLDQTNRVLAWFDKYVKAADE